MALHENFRDYTKEEVKGIMLNHCIKHKCPYLRCLTGQTTNPRYPGEVFVNKCCMYIDLAGHSRGCMPDECEHWKDKNVPKRSKNDI